MANEVEAIETNNLWSHLIERVTKEMTNRRNERKKKLERKLNGYDVGWMPNLGKLIISAVGWQTATVKVRQTRLVSAD